MTNQHQSQPLSEDEQALAAGYVLGDLNDDEQRQISTLLQRRPEMVREVEALKVSLRSLPHGLPIIAPPPQLEANILAAYTNELDTSTSTPPPLQSSSRPFPIAWSRIIAGITTLAAILFGANNFQLRYQLAQSLDENTDTARAVNILQQPNSRLISLEGSADTATTAGGTLLFTAGKWQEVVVSMSNLPPLPVDEVYRMWLTLENGNIIFCGEFNTNADGTVLVQLNPDEVPPKGVKTTGLFVTQEIKSTVPDATEQPIMVGEI